MPHIDDTAKAWEVAMAGRVGEAIAARRKALGMTAVELAAKTRDLGYPISRVAISKMETNNRAGKLAVAEVVVLAEALDVAPVALLYPDLPDGEVERLPGQPARSMVALMSFTGEYIEGLDAEGGLPQLLRLTRNLGKKSIEIERADELLGRIIEREATLRKEDLDPLIGLSAEAEELVRRIAAIPGAVVSEDRKGAR